MTRKRSSTFCGKKVHP